MNMFRKKWNECRLGEHGEAFACHRRKHGGLFIEGEQRTFARAGGFHDRGEHAARGFGEFALARQLRTEVRERFDGAQQPAKIVGLNGQDEWVRA
jgi:hypothetical protein